ncbi:MAG: polysaccharide deacetylase family protein [Actinobacteria bacterium]|nr:MAG: polysaccharide deacetylase family protein [Actinomycetota bacterium]
MRTKPCPYRDPNGCQPPRSESSLMGSQYRLTGPAGPVAVSILRNGERTLLTLCALSMRDAEQPRSSPHGAKASPPPRHRKPSARNRRLWLAALGAVALAATLAIVIDSAGRSQRREPTRAGVRAAGPAVPGTHVSNAERELRVDRHLLSQTSYVRAGSRRRPDVALTFDDGPGPFTPRILAVLQRFGAEATFFEIGRQVRAYPSITARLVRAGMAIGDHTQDHPSLGGLTGKRQAVELDRAARAIHAGGGPWPLLFRPPYGSFNAATLALLRARDMLMVLWTVDTRDYARPRRRWRSLADARCAAAHHRAASPARVSARDDSRAAARRSAARLPASSAQPRRRLTDARSACGSCEGRSRGTSWRGRPARDLPRSARRAGFPSHERGPIE